MARQKLLLHPGTHKTGTTAIQESLSANRDWLASRGVAYPQLFAGRRGTAHHVLAHALADPGDDQLVQHCYNRIKQASDGACLTVLSAEAIYRHALCKISGKGETDTFLSGHRAYLERLRHLLRDFDISVLIYFRRPDRFAVALFKHMVANGNGIAPFGKYVEQFPWRYDYSRRIALFRDVFGTVETRCYEAEAKNGLTAGFYAALGLEDPPLGDPARIRASHTNRATLWLRRTLNENIDFDAHQQRALFARENSHSALFSEPESSTLWPSVSAFTAFVERFRSAYEIGPFNLPRSPGSPTTVWTDDMHAAAEAAFAKWRHANAKRLSQRSVAPLWWQADPPNAVRHSQRIAAHIKRWWQGN